MANEFKTARVISDMTLADAAKASGLSGATYPAHREAKPGKFRLEELRGLYRQMNRPARKALLTAVEHEICR